MHVIGREQVDSDASELFRYLCTLICDSGTWPPLPVHATLISIDRPRQGGPEPLCRDWASHIVWYRQSVIAQLVIVMMHAGPSQMNGTLSALLLWCRGQCQAKVKSISENAQEAEVDERHVWKQKHDWNCSVRWISRGSVISKCCQKYNWDHLWCSNTYSSGFGCRVAVDKNRGSGYKFEFNMR